MRGTTRSIARTAGVCVAVFLLDLLLKPIGPWRLVADGAAYVGLAILSGVVRVDEVRALVAQSRGGRSPAGSAAVG